MPHNYYLKEIRILILLMKPVDYIPPILIGAVAVYTTFHIMQRVGFIKTNLALPFG